MSARQRPEFQRLLQRIEALERQKEHEARQREQLKAALQRHALRAEIREQALRAQIETDKKIETERRGLEERMQAALEQQALRAALESERRGREADKQLLEARLQSQMKELRAEVREQAMLGQIRSLEREIAHIKGQQQLLVRSSVTSKPSSSPTHGVASTHRSACCLWPKRSSTW